MSCNDKTNQRCKKVYAACTSFEGIPNQKTFLEEGCLTIEDTTQDIYEQLTEELDYSNLGDNCLSYQLVNGKLYTKEVLLKMEEEICILKERVEELETMPFFDMPIQGSGLDLLCLVATCDGDQITTVKDLIQSIINRICD